MAGDRLELDGDGERIDGLRALCAAAWNPDAAAGEKSRQPRGGPGRASAPRTITDTSM